MLEKAAGGVILSASHNPAEWNALKLLNETGEFLSPAQAAEVIALATDGEAETVGYERLGAYAAQDLLDAHIRVFNWRNIRRVDWLLAVVVLALAFAGFAVLYSASRSTHSAYYLRQVLFFAFGVVMALKGRRQVNR